MEITHEHLTTLDRGHGEFQVIVEYTVYGGGFDSWRGHVADPEIEFQGATRVEDGEDIELTVVEEAQVEHELWLERADYDY